MKSGLFIIFPLLGYLFDVVTGLKENHEGSFRHILDASIWRLRKPISMPVMGQY